VKCPQMSPKLGSRGLKGWHKIHKKWTRVGRSLTLQFPVLGRRLARSRRASGPDHTEVDAIYLSAEAGADVAEAPDDIDALLAALNDHCPYCGQLLLGPLDGMSA
jgi:hypothetical protein